MRKPEHRQERVDFLLDYELSSLWEGLIYEGVIVTNTKEWFAQSDIFLQILEKLKEENND